MCFKLHILLLTIFAGFTVSVECKNSHEWDILIFTQHWPLTVCLQWKEEEPQHTCVLPTPEDTWTIHGIWPTKLGTEGPAFCNSSMHFNKTQIQTIEKKLEQYWTNIYNGSLYSLWKHEWQKHGTCAAVLPSLNTEVKYFTQGLNWLKEYSMTNILSQSGIEPKSEGYTPETLWNAVQKTTGKNPAVQCIVDPKTKVSYLFEIRICFDKNLTLTDCDGIKTSVSPVGIKTNCPMNKPVIYPGTLPPPRLKPIYENIPQSQGWHPWLIKALHIIQFIQWITF